MPLKTNIVVTQFHRTISSLNNSKVFAGIVMLMLNLGSRYITVKFSDSQEEFLRNCLGKYLLIFAIVWMGTRDIYISFVITIIIYIFGTFFFNEDSNMCMLSESFKTIGTKTESKNGITETDITSAIQTLEKVKKNVTIQPSENPQLAWISKYGTYYNFE